MTTSAKACLDHLYLDYNFQERMRHDPIELVHSYKDPVDIEVAGLIVAALSYGKVSLFKPVAARILKLMGRSPAAYLASLDLQSVREKFFTTGIRYRFSREDDILAFLWAVSKALERFGSLKALFFAGLSENDDNTGSAIGSAMQELRQTDLTPVYGKDIKPPGFLHMMPTSASGGACKRMALYLRWMVRDRDIDFGIWKEMGAHRLVIPLDTHIARISRCLGLTTRRSRDWKMAVEITESLKRFSPMDPLKYDFALCHHGISGRCPSRPDKDACVHCALRGAENTIPSRI